MEKIDLESRTSYGMKYGRAVGQGDNEKAALARVDEQLQSFQGYGVKQCQLLENAVVKVEGNFVFYAVAEDASEYKKIFLSSL